MLPRLAPLACLLALASAPARAGSCAGADPNDGVADDDALTACLAASPLLELDAPAPSGAGYLLNSSGIVVSQNGSSIFVSPSPSGALAVITAGPGLAWPMIYTNGTIVGLSLSGLRIDGNRAARNATMQTLCSADAGARNDNYRTSNVLLPGFRWAEPPTWRCWDPWSRFVAGVSISHCEVVGSPCGAGIGISGRDFVIADNKIAANGGDALHNAQRVAFPYADGLNLAVCANGTVERNLVEDATNMMIAVGPGPRCLVRDNTLVQRTTVAQNGINIWPTNVGEARPWWHPEPWTFAHSAVVRNAISAVRAPGGDVGLLSGIAVGGLAWAAYATEPDAGLVAANVIDGANVGLFVDGARGGAVYGNEVLSVFGSPAWATNCATPHAYTAADANGTLLLQPGFERIAFRQGPCAADAEQPPVASAVDDAAFVSQSVDGVTDPASVTVACGAPMALTYTFANTGSTAWQDMPAGLGVLAGAAPRAEPYYFAGAARAAIGAAVEVAPGGTATVNISASAPLAAGTYALQWQMVREPLAAFFGAPSPAVAVVVQCGGAAPAQRLQASVDAAIAAGAGAVVAAAGVIPFGARNLEVNGGADFALRAPGVGATTLVFAPGFGVLVQGCARTELSGFVIDYDPPCFTQGAVVAVAAGGAAGAPGSVDVRLDAGFPLPNASWFASSETKLQFYADDALRRRDPAQPAFQPVAGAPAEAAPGVWRFPAVWQAAFAPRVGQLATISPRANTSGFVIPDYYSGNAVNVLNSSAVVVADVAVLGSGNFAVLEWGGAGAHVFRRLTVARPRAHLLSSNCDGFHSFSCGRGAAVEDSAVAFAGDDLANFHNREGLVLADATAARFLVVDVGDVPSPLGGGAPPLRAMDDLRPGDALRVFAPGGAGALLATVAVADAARSADAAALAAARALLTALGFDGRVNPSAVALFNVSGAANGGAVLPAGSVVQFDRRASAGGALVRVRAEDLYDSCGRLQAAGVRMVNSTCRRARSGLTVVYDAPFLEGTRAIAGVAIRDNVFAAVGDPPAANMSQVLVRDADAQVAQSGNDVRQA